MSTASHLQLRESAKCESRQPSRGGRGNLILRLAANELPRVEPEIGWPRPDRDAGAGVVTGTFEDAALPFGSGQSGQLRSAKLYSLSRQTIRFARNRPGSKLATIDLGARECRFAQQPVPPSAGAASSKVCGVAAWKADTRQELLVCIPRSDIRCEAQVKIRPVPGAGTQSDESAKRLGPATMMKQMAQSPRAGMVWASRGSVRPAPQTNHPRSVLHSLEPSLHLPASKGAGLLSLRSGKDAAR